MPITVAVASKAPGHSGAPAEFTLQKFFGDIRGALVKMAEDFADFIPKVMLALVLLFLGFVFAKLLAKLVKTAFARLGVDSLLESSGVNTILQRAGL